MAPPQLCGCTCLHLECAQPSTVPSSDPVWIYGLVQVWVKGFGGRCQKRVDCSIPRNPTSFHWSTRLLLGSHWISSPGNQDTLCLGLILRLHPCYICDYSHEEAAEMKRLIFRCSAKQLWKIVRKRFRTLSKRQI